MTAPRLRPAERADIAQIDALLQRSYPRLLKQDYPPSVLVTALPRMVRAQPALIASGSYYVVEDAAARLVGAGGWTMAIPGSTQTEAGRANIRHVVADPDCLRQGIARRILTHSMQTARAAGATWMHCLSTRTAVPFYTAMGFATLREIDVQMGPGVVFPAIEMRRDLV